MTHLTLGYLTLNVPPLEMIDAAAAAGFASIGLRLAGRRKTDPFPQILGQPARLREIRRRLDDNGLRLSSIIGHVFSDETTDDDLARLAEAALELRANYFLSNVYMPEAAFLAAAEKLIDATAGSGIAIAVEFLKYSSCRTIGEALDLAERSGRPELKLTIDPLHLARSGGTYAQVAALPQERIAFAQLCDAPRLTAEPTDEMLIAEARAGRLEPGEGDLDLEAFLDALPRDVEIEYEVTHARYRDMPAGERARHAYDAFRSYLDTYAAARGFAYDWGPRGEAVR